jgi:hypothetical protein
MLLLFIDALLFSVVGISVFVIIRNLFRKHKQTQIEEAIFRQQVAEELAKKVEILDNEKMKLNEKKVNDKLNGLH